MGSGSRRTRVNARSTPARHWHLGQGWLHPPQCAVLVCVSTHAPPQSMPLVPQVHMPLEHIEPVGHVFPHMPQLVVSVPRFTQLVPHAVSPAGHAHAPPNWWA